MDLIMALTEKEQREMYSDIKVIKNNCLFCSKRMDDHEKRIKSLEQTKYWIAGACAVISYIVGKVLG